MSQNSALAVAMDSPNLSVAMRRVADLCRDEVAVRTLDDSVSLTYGALLARADALAGGLAKLGLGHGQTLAIMMSNRPEFMVADMAALMLGAVPFSIYQTLAPEQIQYVVEDADARIAIVEAGFLPKFQEAAKGLPKLEHVIVLDREGGDRLLTLADVEASGSGFDAATTADAIKPGDLLTLIYTSGTTGPPKGVQLSHANVMHGCRGLAELVELPIGTRVISWLPTAHIAERAVNYYVPLAIGGTITTCPDPRQIATYLPQVKPHFFFAVPRIWEKMKAGLETQLASMPDEQRDGIQAALAQSLERVRLRQSGEPVPETLDAAVEKADREIFSMIRGLVGLDEAKVTAAGAAPTPREVLEFFHALGVKLGEGWGMSETTGIGTASHPDEIRIGTVGKALPGVEIRLADDNEILVRGANIMVSYRNLPEKTAETIDADGWLATGDIGSIDEDGYVSIVDRKKEIIINAAGKNMSPANIESTMKGASPLIGQICAIGDARPYNTALIVLDADYAPAWAASHGIEGTSLAQLASDERVVAGVQAAIDLGNAKLARVEQIKKFTLLANEWLPGADELTPTMKLKRKPIAEKYAAEIGAMYS